MLGFEAWWLNARLAPQFDALGDGAMATHPWSVELFGAGISAGRHLHILSSRDAPVRLTTWPTPGGEARITLGDCVLLTGGVRLLAARAIEIGDGCMLARSACVTDCDWHGLYDRVTAVVEPAPVRLGTNVWVGDGAFIGKGVTVGDNAVIGARAVVVKDVPANTIVAGNPAQPVKALDPDAPRRTRMDLYADAGAVSQYFDDSWRAAHAGNSTLGWLRARLAPRRGD